VSDPTLRRKIADPCPGSISKVFERGAFFLAAMAHPAARWYVLHVINNAQTSRRLPVSKQSNVACFPNSFSPQFVAKQYILQSEDVNRKLHATRSYF